MKFKSIEDNLKETGYKIITTAENIEELFTQSLKIAFGIAEGKYKNCAIVPTSILTEGNHPIERNYDVLYVLPTTEKNKPNFWYKYDFNKKENEARYLVNENDFKAKIQTRHPYQSWHNELKNRGFVPFSLSGGKDLYHEISKAMFEIAKQNASEIILLPQEIAFEGEKWIPEEKLTSAIYLKKINDLKDNSIGIKRYVFAEKKSGNLEFMDFS